MRECNECWISFLAGAFFAGEIFEEAALAPPIVFAVARTEC